MQMVSTVSDGLVKLWNIREEECVATLDNHEDKASALSGVKRASLIIVVQVWALAVSTDGRTIVSGAADSVLTFWEDCTEEEEKKKEDKRAEMVSKSVDGLLLFVNSDLRLS
jgi:U3 small nucleolar RNA-associated protein 13